MQNNKKSVKFTYVIINASILLLFALALVLPWLITWYVEVRHKDAGLPLVVMLTFYPTFPFAVVALFSLRKMFKNILSGLVFGDENLSAFKKVAICCLSSAIITFVAGFYYAPFFVVSIAAAGCALIVKTIKDIFAIELQKQREQLYDSVREEL